jgi:Ca2+-binding RTX toxin-like protein
VRLRRVLKFVILSMLGLILISVGAASTASITVPATNVDDSSRGITIDDIKPVECTMNLTALLICPPDCSGSNANELILGSPNAEWLRGKNGDDCILGGGGDDDIWGDNGNDVCIGGPGNDTFRGCEVEIP